MRDRITRSRDEEILFKSKAIPVWNAMKHAARDEHGVSICLKWITVANDENILLPRPVYECQSNLSRAETRSFYFYLGKFQYVTRRNTNTQLFRKTKCKRFNYQAMQQHYSNIFMQLLINFLSLSLSLVPLFREEHFSNCFRNITYCVRFVQTPAHFSVSNCSINFSISS